MNLERLENTSPLAIAHRAGNDLTSLHAAEAAGVDLVEADIWLCRDRLEVRHLKTMGPFPLLWDRWKLASGWAPRLLLGDMLAALGPGVEPMLDLKGSTPRTATEVLTVARRVIPGRRFTVCSQQWHLLEAFQAEPNARVVYSVGSEQQLRTLLARLSGRGAAGISIHQRLLTPPLVAKLRSLAPLVMTWPVNTRQRLHELLAWGINGVISDDLTLLRGMVRERVAVASAAITR
jgi:glycerophosphoryl diester phosphodiesterase